MCYYNHWIILSNLHSFSIEVNQLNLEIPISKIYSGKVRGTHSN